MAAELRVIAYHEAAHAVAGAHFDRPPAVVTIEPGQGYLGITQGEVDDDGTEEHILIRAYAGYAAER